MDYSGATVCKGKNLYKNKRKKIKLLSLIIHLSPILIKKRRNKKKVRKKKRKTLYEKN